MNSTIQMPDFSVKGLNILLTGATGYLGRQMSLALANAGANMFINSSNLQRLSELEKEMQSMGLKVHSAHFNIRSQIEINNFFSNVPVKHFNVVINNAYSGSSGGVFSTDTKNFEDSFEVGVTAPFLISKLAIPFLRTASSRREVASIINIASMYGVIAPKFDIYQDEASYNSPNYGASKAALIHLTKYMGAQLAPEGIRVNCISPGPFPSLKAQENQKLVSGICQKSPFKRIGRPDELLGAVFFLASHSSSYVTGSNIAVDGGWTISS
jgi:NAD(P)-dependent dehydrogenase (short-subunit alcohol dehydrogenase family)